MDRLIEFFARNPVLLLVVVVWLAGIVGNVAKAAKRARDAAPRRSEPTSLPSPQPMRSEPPQARAPVGDARPMGQRDAEEVAREMRRILGLEPEAGRRAPEPAEGRAEPLAGDRAERQDALPRPVLAQQQPTPPAPPRRPVAVPRLPVERAEQLPARSRRDVATPERAPTPVQPSTNRRRLEIHVDPHVGESIGKRARVGSGKVGDRALGELGGRSHGAPTRAVRGARYELDDLKRAFVLSEILGPPLASRPERRDA
ncbi:MAG: hypothetical protein FJ306_11790 [Planctomycetes bacterium]|nr:hypothetical protein [Planctomycetota bacterium]